MTTRDIRTWAPPRPLRRPVAARIAFWVLFGLAVVALIACFAVPVLTVKPFTMPSDAMENTISPGDSVFAVTGDLRRGDIVVIRLPPKLAGSLGPGQNSYVLTRLIALPGDHVACCNASGRVTVNGKALNETYLFPHQKPSIRQFSVTLRRGQIWVMGDHRSISADSREWGPLPESGVAGRVILIHSGSSTTAPRTPQTYVANGLAPVDKRYEFWVLLAVIAVASVALIVILTIFGTIRFVVRRRRNRRLAEPPRLPYALRPVVRRAPVTPAAPASAPSAPPAPSEPAPAREPATPTADRPEAPAESSEEPGTPSPEASANTHAEPPAAKAAEPPVAEAADTEDAADTADTADAVDAVDAKPGEASVDAS